MDPIHYYISRDNGPQEGPFTSNQIGLFISTGRLARTDLIWREGLTNWQSCDSLPEVAELFQRVTPAVSAPIGPVSRPYVRKYAGFWIRLLACIIDTIVLTIAQLPLGCAFGLWTAALDPAGISSLMTPKPVDLADPFGFNRLTPEQMKVQILSVVVSILFKWLYYAFMESSKLQGSVGKWALGLQVTTLDGNRISFTRASGRFFASILSTLPFGIGYLVIAFTPQKQAFHDVLAATVVIHKR